MASEKVENPAAQKEFLFRSFADLLGGRLSAALRIDPPSAGDIFFEFSFEIWICCLHNHLKLFVFLHFFISLL